MSFYVFLYNLLYTFLHIAFFPFSFKLAMAIVLFWSQHCHIFDSVSLNVQQLSRLYEKQNFLL